MELCTITKVIFYFGFSFAGMGQLSNETDQVELRWFNELYIDNWCNPFVATSIAILISFSSVKDFFARNSDLISSIIFCFLIDGNDFALNKILR